MRDPHNAFMAENNQQNAIEGQYALRSSVEKHSNIDNGTVHVTIMLPKAGFDPVPSCFFSPKEGPLQCGLVAAARQ
jgi:hypothetical protein